MGFEELIFLFGLAESNTRVLFLHLADITVGVVGEQDFAVMVRGVTEAHANYVQKRQINLFLV